MKRKILFVDDDRYFSDKYVSHLAELFEVIRLSYALDVIAYLDQHHDIELIVLDIMMPTPAGVASSATVDGMDTGLWLLHELRILLRKRRIPVLIYTNRKDTDVIKERILAMKLPEGLVLVRTKRSKGARDLPKVALDHLEGFTLIGC